MKYYKMLVACYDEKTEKIYDKGATYSEEDFSEYKLMVYGEANLFVEVAAPASSPKPKKQAVESSAVKSAKAKIKAAKMTPAEKKATDAAAKEAEKAEKQAAKEAAAEDKAARKTLNKFSPDELKEMAADLDIDGGGNMKKDALVDAILDARAQDEGEVEDDSN